MKIYKQLILSLLTLFLALACNKGIDPISSVAPGADALAPVVTITYPAEGTEVSDMDSSINIKFDVTDDIEIKSILLKIDGVEASNFSSFKDYRHAILEYHHTNLTMGKHVISITATDMEGKNSTVIANFQKKAYIPVFSGEIFYMNFDGVYVDRISYKKPTIVGNPGYAGTGVKGSNAYKGANDSYLSIPLTGLTSGDFTAAFWYKVNPSPDRSGILNVSPSGEDRTKGFRLFREGGAIKQRIKLNVGNGSGEVWNDGQEINATGADWVHVAMVISGSGQKCSIYINGQESSVPFTGAIDWTGCSSLSIGSGAPNFTYWNHKSDLSFYDELRLFNKALTQSEIQAIIEHDKPYAPKYSGEVFYMPFDGNFKELISKTDATQVGTPVFNAGKIGKAYAGAVDSYLTFPTTAMVGSSYSAVFWYKVNASPDRSGILSASLAGEDRTKGFRLFREGSASAQRIKLNVGTGAGETWNDGQEIAAPAAGWVHIAFTVSPTHCIVYIDGVVAADAANTGVDWTGCSVLSIGSGAPNFIYWGHSYDLSLYDELRIFNKELSQAEIQAIIAAEN
jgi:hypothetical protein